MNKINNQTELGWFGYTDKIKEFKEQVEIVISVKNNVLQAQSARCTGGCKPKEVKEDSGKKNYEKILVMFKYFQTRDRITRWVAFQKK